MKRVRGELLLGLMLAAAATACGAPRAVDCPKVDASASTSTTASAAPPPREVAPSEPPADDVSPLEEVVEMPRGQPAPDAEEALTLWNEAVTLAREAKPRTLKCQRVVSAKTRYAFMTARVQPDAVRKDEAAYLRIARCAEQLGSFGFMGEIGAALMRALPEGGHPELVARAWLGKRRPELALKALAQAEQRAPKDPNVPLTLAKVHCTMAHWADCRAAADRASLLADPLADADERRRALAGAHKYRARALAHEGALDRAAEELAKAEELRGKWSDIEDIRDEIAMARREATIVDIVADDEVPLGAYHLIATIEPDAPMLRVTLNNLSDSEVRYRIEVDVAGVFQPTRETVTVKKKGARWVDVNPVLRPDLPLETIRGPVPSNVTVKVTKLDPSGERPISERSVKTTLSPRDYLPMGSFEDELGRGFRRDARYVAAWVTPNDRSVEAFLTEAKKRLARGRSFDGPQSASIPQVRALFEALRQRGVSYVMDPEVLTKDVRSQRTRLPAEVLASTNAQCLEGSILYATLLESIGLQPAIVYVPGHAFVAWRPTKDDRSKEKWLFLETTMTGGSGPFDKAMEAAKARFAKTQNPHVADITALRKDGVTPQPTQVAPSVERQASATAR